MFYKLIIHHLFSPVLFVPGEIIITLPVVKLFICLLFAFLAFLVNFVSCASQLPGSFSRVMFDPALLFVFWPQLILFAQITSLPSKMYALYSELEIGASF